MDLINGKKLFMYQCKCFPYFCFRLPCYPKKNWNSCHQFKIPYETELYITLGRTHYLILNFGRKMALYRICNLSHARAFLCQFPLRV